MSMQLVKLSYLTIGSPTQVAVASVPQIQVRYLSKLARRVKARGQLISERLVVNKTISVGRANSPFVETLSSELAPLHACDLRPYQGGAVFEVFGTIFSPKCQPLVMLGESFE